MKFILETSKSVKDGCIIIMCKVKTGPDLIHLINRVEEFVKSHGDYKVENFYLTPNNRLSNTLSFKTNIPVQH